MCIDRYRRCQSVLWGFMSRGVNFYGHLVAIAHIRQGGESNFGKFSGRCLLYDQKIQFT